MQKFRFILFIIIPLAIGGCKKTDMPETEFVTNLVSDTSMAAVSAFETDDHGIIVVGRSFDNLTLGSIYKVNAYGDEVWRKKLSKYNLFLWKGIQTSDKGFITVGYPELFNPAMYICKYNQDGVLLKTAIDTLPENSSQFSYADFKELSNGNFMFCLTSVVMGYSFVIVTDPSLNILSSRKYESHSTLYFGCFIRGIQESENNTIAITASTSGYKTSTLYTNLVLIKTDNTGKELSRTNLIDSTYSEMPTSLNRNNNELFAITSKMIGWNSGKGLFVDYLANPNAQFISGEIQLVRFDHQGNYLGRKTYNGYPGNGIINSVHKTLDGGFLLCGTVNQNNYQTVAANTQIYVMKLNANYQTEWSKSFNTTYPSLGIEALPLSNGGYCLIGHQKTFNDKFNIILIKSNF
jgi:hypothetical protein